MFPNCFGVYFVEVGQAIVVTFRLEFLVVLTGHANNIPFFANCLGGVVN
jgi:hypothetical protein